VTCENCRKNYSLPLKRYNESLKKGWNFYCSERCLKEFRKNGKVLTCDNSECSKKFYRSVCKINPKRNFCSQSCAASVNNRTRKHPYRKQDKDYKIKGIKSLKLSKDYVLKKECAFSGCDKKIPDRNKYCSNKCQMKAQRKSKEYYKKKSLRSIRDFFLENGRIPLKAEMYDIYKYARKGFGTWNKAIKAAGYKPNPVLFAHRHEAKDGHICDSFSEMLVDDWLYKYSISHEINIPYPEKENLTADFKVGKYWIEFFGLEGEVSQYDKNVKKKLELAKKYQLELLRVYPSDLFPNFKLEKSLKPVLYHYAKSFVLVI
jgi:hypothetical protein